MPRTRRSTHSPVSVATAQCAARDAAQCADVRRRAGLYWSIVVRPRKRLLAVAVLAVLFGLSAIAPRISAADALHARIPRPAILSLVYGRFRPLGSPQAYLAFRLRVRQKHGQVVEITYQEVNKGGIPSGFLGDVQSRCGIGGRRSGTIETFYLPVERLRFGVHRIRVVAYGSLCAKNRATRSSTRVFVVEARRSVA